ncbi:hypothetical protein N7E81_17495 [Reichenbachiella carrageenanivorans]|uniref:Secreted protein n=1 Tax=Reichenbachiella carrageenanivorans TaxID=2979869 RepID=A0ABY6CZ05_9BACT|nr:hypothetical protein [Reichenbachiella carrageenanivorans]UXX79150.1 hypothetical protein N7E81_17495 [Reichenbachiella carrageenanivorans]
MTFATVGWVMCSLVRFHAVTQNNPPHILAHLVFARTQIQLQKIKRAKISPLATRGK